jgi:predicted phosphodiesterase
MAEPTPRQKAVAAILKKFPQAGHRTLAKRLHDDNPALFTSVENARSLLRTATGNHGDAKRKEVRTVAMDRPPRKPGEHPPLPKSEAKPWEPYVLECKRCLVLSDLHLPWHDSVALEAALAYGEQFQPDAILINGDLLDAYSLSRFDKDPTKPKIAYELECCKQFFAHLRSRFPDTNIVWREGNHDYRMEQYLMANAPLFFEIEGARDVWHTAAGIPQHGVKYVREQRPVMLGELMVLHGHEQGKGIANPVNPARGAFMRMLSCVLIGHSHRQSEHTERTADGKVIACWSTGALCGLWPDYAKINRWSSGFATVLVEPSGEYEVRLHRIIDGKVY